MSQFRHLWERAVSLVTATRPGKPLRRSQALVLEGLELRLIPSVDTSGPLGTWYLNDNSSRVTAMIRSGPQPNTYLGSLINENGGTETLDQISWNAATRLLEFRRNGPGFWQWYHGSIVEGIYVGRFSQSTSSASRPALTGSTYAFHVTGWDSDYLDQDIAPRVYDVIMNTNYRTELRIDRSPTNPSQFIGRLKVYATVNGGANGEEPEYDVDVTHWDGHNLSFVRHDPNWTQTFTGVATGRTISGTFTQTGSSTTYVWSGARSNVLTYGLDPKSDAGRSGWQDRTRRALEHLMMADDPAPLTTQVTVLQSNLAPFPSTHLPPDRDDNPAAWPRNYRVSELQFDYTLPNPYGGAPMTRRAHGYLTVPTTPPPAGCQRPAVVAVNGHGGSAWKMMNPDDSLYWYGDAYARRGDIVLALDISTRPVSDRRGLYDNDPNGLDPAHGNGPHPSIKAPGFDADFEEEGERVWDAMRGLDYLLGRSDVDPHQVLTTGLSLGGEVATIFGALEPRLAMSIPTGFSPDLNVMYYHGNDRDWLWNNADVREYVDTSDYHALTAPRPLIVETGKVDFTFSSHNPPFAADKQVARRTRVAYNGGPFFHYLHYDEHHYHVGDINPTRSTEQGVRVPTVTQPQPPGTLGWQSDSTTAVQYRNLFEAIGALLPPASCVTHFQVRLQPPVAPVVAGSPVRLVVTALDNNGLPDAAYRGTTHFQSTDAAATLPADYTFTAADHGSHTITVTLRTAGSRTVTATAGGRPPIVGSVTLVVHPAAASHFVVQVPATTTAGAPLSMTITARDPFNNVATGYRGTIAFSSNDGQATLPGNYAFTAADSGVHTFAGVILRTAGNRTISVRDLGAGFTATATVAVTPAAASRLEVGLPASATAGAAFDGIVTVRDPYNNVATGYRGTVSWSSDDSQASLPANYTFTVGDAGVHPFRGLILRTAGNRTATVRDTIAGFTTSTHVVVSPTAASQLILSAPAGSVAGTAFAVTVTARDPFQNLATGYRGTVHWSSDDSQASLPPNYAFTASDAGVHTFTGLVLRTASNRTITITDTVTGSLTRSAVVLVTAAPADHFDVTAPDSSMAGQPFDVTVTARDPYGNVDGHYLGTVTFTSADTAASLPADYAFTARDSGVHTFSGGVTLVTAGDQDVTTTDTTSGITGTAIVTVTPAAVDHFQVSAPAQVPSGTAFDVTVMAVDAYGNLVPDYTGTVTFTCTDQDPNVLLASDYTFTPADGGMQTFSGGVTLITVGDQTLTVMDAANQLQGSTLVTVDPAGTAPGAQPKPADHRARSLAEIISAWAAGGSVRPEDRAQEQVRRDRFFAAQAEAAA